MSNDPSGTHVVRLRWAGRGVPVLIPNSVRLTSALGAKVEAGLEISYPAGVPLEVLDTSGLPKGWSLVLVNDDPTAMQTDPYSSPTSAVGKASLRLKAVAPTTLGELKAVVIISVRQGAERHDLRLSVEFDGHEGLRALPKRLLVASDTLDGLLGLERAVVLQTENSNDEIKLVRKPSYLEIRFDRAAQAGDPGKPRVLVMKARIASPPPSRFGRDELEVRDSDGRRLVIPVLVSFDS